MTRRGPCVQASTPLAAGEPTPGAPAALFVAGIAAADLGDPLDHPRAERSELEGLARRRPAHPVTEAAVTRLHAATSATRGRPRCSSARCRRARARWSRARRAGELLRRVLARAGAR